MILFYVSTGPLISRRFSFPYWYLLLVRLPLIEFTLNGIEQ